MRPLQSGIAAGLPLLVAVALPQLLPGGLFDPRPAAAAPVSICYQQVSGQAERPDIEQLRLDLDGARVSGFYRWIPWQKDRRLGRLEGRLVSPGSAKLLVRLQQEGQSFTAPLTVVFNGRQARLDWNPSGASGQPLPPVLLPRHTCTQLKSVSGL